MRLILTRMRIGGPSGGAGTLNETSSECASIAKGHMSIADTQRTKNLERRVDELEARLLLLEMQKRPVEAIGTFAEQLAEKSRLQRDGSKTITLRGRAA